MDKFVINRNKPNELVKKTIENAINNEKESNTAISVYTDGAYR